MSLIPGRRDRSTAADHAVWEQFVWFRQLGYVRIRDVVRGGTLVYVFLTALVTVLTSDPYTLVFLGMLAVIALRFASLERYVSPRRRVTLYTKGGLFIAEHRGTGANRRGETAEDALTNLDGVLERRRAGQPSD